MIVMNIDIHAVIMIIIRIVIINMIIEILIIKICNIRPCREHMVCGGIFSHKHDYLGDSISMLDHR